jgi:uncharacterized protein YqjF (DUF2071 family)/uncharacterized membrane protein
MISRLCLSLLLMVAGILHILYPEMFDPAIPFQMKYEINLFAGVLEILLSIGLWIPRVSDLSSKICALWFLLLIPIHLYVSYFKIPMFGVDQPAFLWTRTLLQPLLFFWSLNQQRSGWIISQQWKNILFLHYEVNPEELQKLVPYPIDLYHGKGVVSIVPFVMKRIRFPFLPSVPGLSKLFELNLRTYVRVNNRPAVYFFTLDSNHLIAVLIARLGFSLPYRYKTIEISNRATYRAQSDNLFLEAEIGPELIRDEFHQWTTERYALITKRFGRDMWGVVEHEKWKLQRVKLIEIRDQFSPQYLKLNHFLGASYAETLDVRFRPFISINANER